MKAKSIIELLTLSTNLYMISKDEEFIETLSEMLKKGKKKAEDILDNFSDTGAEDEDKLIKKLLIKAQDAREQLERKMDDTAVFVYRKMHIAYAADVEKLAQELECLKQKLTLAEARIANMESPSRGSQEK
jgi:polyhydroxyalkanoate synthesis regulator phasin